MLDGTKPAILWTAKTLPSVIAVAATPAEIARSDTKHFSLRAHSITAQSEREHLFYIGDSVFRVNSAGDVNADNMSVVLPMDDLFEVRLKAARRLWLALKNRKVPPDPARLTKPQRDHYVLALRALDGRLTKSSTREIAAVLFGAKRISERAWKTHDLRDRTIRLWRLGADMMQGGYRHLLLYPYRKRLKQASPEQT